MGLEQRGNNSYHYRKRWVNGTCKSEYLGSGETFDLIARLEALERAQERQQRAAFKREEQRNKDQTALVLGAESDIRGLVKAVLIACGFYQHKRQWRKSSMDTYHEIVTIPSAPPASKVDDKALMAEARAALNAAFDVGDTSENKRGRAGDQAKAERQEARRVAVRKVLEQYPILWSGARHMFTTAEDSLIKSLTDDGMVQNFMEFGLRAFVAILGMNTRPCRKSC